MPGVRANSFVSGPPMTPTPVLSDNAGTSVMFRLIVSRRLPGLCL
jgi:hypothetical protein